MAPTSAAHDVPLHTAQRSPSRASKRAAVAAVAMLGALIAARLAAYELAWMGPPWEPLFGRGSELVLRSSLSRALPVPDAVLGMFAYLAEVAAVAWGSTERWRENRLAVYVYAAIAIGMALGSAGLVAVQATVVHAFCTLCLASAAISLLLVVPAWTELAAAVRSKRAEGLGS